MLSPRKAISRFVANALSRRYNLMVCRGNPRTVPLWLWKLSPNRVREWLSYNVLAAAEQAAEATIAADPELKILALPVPNSWAIPAVEILYIRALLARLKPRRIIEMGSGRSTLLFALYARAHEDLGVDILSVDHDAEWLAKTKDALLQNDLLPYVRLVHAPLAANTNLAPPNITYSIPEQELQGAGPFDLCLIDGPPGSVGRGATLPLIANHLANNATILLDDIYRPGEQRVWRRWTELYPGQICNTAIVLADEHGLAAGQWIDVRAGKGPAGGNSFATELRAEGTRA